MSLLVAAAVEALSSDRPFVACAVGVMIALSSLSFFLLDLRTQELIAYGETLMAATEARIAANSGVAEVAFVSAMHG